MPNPHTYTPTTLPPANPHTTLPQTPNPGREQTRTPQLRTNSSGAGAGAAAATPPPPSSARACSPRPPTLLAVIAPDPAEFELGPIPPMPMSSSGLDSIRPISARDGEAVGCVAGSAWSSGLFAGLKRGGGGGGNATCTWGPGIPSLSRCASAAVGAAPPVAARGGANTHPGSRSRSTRPGSAAWPGIWGASNNSKRWAPSSARAACAAARTTHPPQWPPSSASDRSSRARFASLNAGHTRSATAAAATRSRGDGIP